MVEEDAMGVIFQCYPNIPTFHSFSKPYNCQSTLVNSYPLCVYLC